MIPISCAVDVLTWVCKKVFLYEPRRLRRAMKVIKPKWLRASRFQMQKPYCISSDCYVDLACSDETALLRAALVLKWVGLTAAVGVTTHAVSPPTSITAAPLPPPATKPGGLNFAAVARAKEVGGEAYEFQPKGVPVKAYEKPVSLFVGEKEYPLKNWRDLMIKTCDILAEKNLALLKDLASRFGRNFLAATSDGMRDPRLHASSGLFMELYMAPQGLLRHSQLLFHEAGCHDVWLVYLKSALTGKESEMSQVERSSSVCAANLVDVNAFEADLMESYADGFDFRETSRRLVEGRVGKAMTEAVAKALQARMFERKDGVWLFPQMVMDDAARVKMTARAKELLANEGAFAAA